MTDKLKFKFTLALALEQGNIDNEIIWRATLFEIDHDDGAALILEIAEAPTAREAGECILSHFRDEAIAAKTDENTDGAVSIGNHWIVWPDCSSTLIETAEALS